MTHFWLNFAFLLNSCSPYFFETFSLDYKKYMPNIIRINSTKNCLDTSYEKYISLFWLVFLDRPSSSSFFGRKRPRQQDSLFVCCR